jgi:hypothetical protein
MYTGKNYTQRVLPNILEMSSHQGGPLGERFRVSGTGLSKDK